MNKLADPDHEKNDQRRLQAKAHLERLNRRRALRDDLDDGDPDYRRPELKLNEYENMIALEMVAPEDIPVGFDGQSQ